MLPKPTIQFLRSLKIRKFREESRSFTVEGTKSVTDILNSHLNIRTIYASQSWLKKYAHQLSDITDRCVPVSEKEMNAISSLTTPQEVLGVVEIPETLMESSEMAGELVLMLDEIRDPGNLGTIIRTADWFGIRFIVCSSGCVDAYNPKVVQATMGSIARVQMHYTDLGDFLRNHNPSLTVYGCLLDGSDIRTTRLEQQGIILLGNESTGISPHLLPFIQVKLTIPSFPHSFGNSSGAANSLNAAQACSIVCFAFRNPLQ
ncbi:MAG: RNA methyltransferase [Lentimicrobiaceae bacterium]|nr:RNA methyltransferase [Lentimicrobiaceae bacterium]